MKQGQKETSLQKWFDRLLAPERAVCLTVMDPDLVAMVKLMLSKYMEYGGGSF